MYRILCIFILVFGIYLPTSAAVFPFSDVTDNTIRTHISTMLDMGAIVDNGSSVFSWSTLATREFWSSLLVASNCESCLVPSADDITQYDTVSGLNISSPYYYCMAKSQDVLASKTTCLISNGWGYCPSDTLTRMEAIESILQKSNIWNDTLNSGNYARDITITDIETTSERYGYAKKAIELGLISQDGDWYVYPDTTITRSEAVKMASAIQGYKQCQPSFVESMNSTGVTLTASWVNNTISIELSGLESTSYRWSLWDGSIRTTENPRITHTYERSGTYILSVVALDRANTPRIASSQITVTGILDTDRDGINDDTDICPLVSGTLENNGCPVINTKRYGETITSLLAGITKSSDYTLLSGINTNACLLGKNNTNGLIIAEPICDQCPCQNRVTILSQVRSCDILFPSILSPDASLIYSRGGFYQIP